MPWPDGIELPQTSSVGVFVGLSPRVVACCPCNGSSDLRSLDIILLNKRGGPVKVVVATEVLIVLFSAFAPELPHKLVHPPRVQVSSLTMRTSVEVTEALRVPVVKDTSQPIYVVLGERSRYVTVVTCVISVNGLPPSVPVELKHPRYRPVAVKR